ncbi:MAG: B12-binding domain-containing radical SAM protein [Spirochaetes bacterium]|nr:B12-binding domain-containing radical SAM protein [Spirochaetota bacterium]
MQLRDLNAALVQLPLPDADPGTASANVPLAAGCLRAYAAAHGGPAPGQIRVLPRDLAGHGGDEAILAWLSAGGFDVVGFTTHVWSLDRALLLVERLRGRSPGTRVLFGGPEVAPDRPVLASPVVDACVIGEGESAFLEAISDLAAGGLGSGGPGPRQYRAAGPVDLSSFPNPYLAGLVERDPSDPVYLETVRGCPNRCSYCFYAKEFPGVREWPAGVLEAIFPWAVANGVPEIYLMDPTFNGMPGWEAKLEAIARLNGAGIPLHTELRLESVEERHAALFRRAGFRSIEAGLQSTNPAALRAVRRTWNRERFLRGASALKEQGIVIRTGVILGLPGDTPEGFRATVRFLEDAGLADDMEVYPLSVLPGTDLRRDAAALGVAHMGFPPYHVLSTPTMSAEEVAESIRWLERERGAEFFAPVAPAFRDPAPGLTGFLDLRIPGALEAARASPERLANNLTLLAGDELLSRPGILEGFGQWLLGITPSSMVQLVLETDAPLAASRLDLIAESFHDPAHYFNRARHLDDDPQGRASIRLFRLTADARAAARALTAGEACDLILRWPARPAALARRLLPYRPFLLVDPGFAAREQRDLLRLYRGHERLVLKTDRPV